MPKIVAIDPSTKTGIAAVEYDPNALIGVDQPISWNIIEVKELTVKKKYETNVARAKHIATMIMKFIRKHAPEIVFIEGYSYASKYNSIIQVEIGAIIRHELMMCFYPYYDVAPTALKKFVTGKGNSAKDRMMLEVYKRWGFEGTDNEADAVGLAMFGAVAGGCLMNMPKKHMETISEFWKNHPEIKG